jgi:hypothetical protein
MLFLLAFVFAIAILSGFDLAMHLALKQGWLDGLMGAKLVTSAAQTAYFEPLVWHLILDVLLAFVLSELFVAFQNAGYRHAWVTGLALGAAAAAQWGHAYANGLLGGAMVALLASVAGAKCLVASLAVRRALPPPLRV